MDCSVCTEIVIAPTDAENAKETKGREGRLLKCGHAFHADCIDRWLATQLLDTLREGCGVIRVPTCPNCRTPLQQEEIPNRSIRAAVVMGQSPGDRAKTFLMMGVVLYLRALELLKDLDNTDNMSDAADKELIDLSANASAALAEVFRICRSALLAGGVPRERCPRYPEFVARALLFSFRKHRDNVRWSDELDPAEAHAAITNPGGNDLDEISSLSEPQQRFWVVTVDICTRMAEQVENE